MKYKELFIPAILKRQLYAHYIESGLLSMHDKNDAVILCAVINNNEHESATVCFIANGKLCERIFVDMVHAESYFGASLRCQLYK